MVREFAGSDIKYKIVASTRGWEQRNRSNQETRPEGLGPDFPPLQQFLLAVNGFPESPVERKLCFYDGFPAEDPTGQTKIAQGNAIWTMDPKHSSSIAAEQCEKYPPGPKSK